MQEWAFFGLPIGDEEVLRVATSVAGSWAIAVFAHLKLRGAAIEPQAFDNSPR